MSLPLQRRFALARDKRRAMKSRVNREVQAGLCEGLGVKSPGATRQTQFGVVSSEFPVAGHRCVRWTGGSLGWGGSVAICADCGLVKISKASGAPHARTHIRCTNGGLRPGHTPIIAVSSPVPNCEGPVAPSSGLGQATEIVATRQ